MNTLTEIRPGIFLGTERRGDEVVLQFEHASITISRSGGIALAYCLSELVE